MEKIRYQPQLWQAFESEVLEGTSGCPDPERRPEFKWRKGKPPGICGKTPEDQRRRDPGLCDPRKSRYQQAECRRILRGSENGCGKRDVGRIPEIYGDFGYNEAKSEAPDSLSYLVELNDTTWLMMLDTTVCEPENEVYGEIKEGTLEWMEECLKEAYAEGITVIPVDTTISSA